MRNIIAATTVLPLVIGIALGFLIRADVDVWAAAGIWVGPFVAVVAGVFVFRYQQDMQDARQRFITDGIQKLNRALSHLLEIHVQNNQVGTFLIRTLKMYERGHPLTPDPDEFPRMVGLNLEPLAIDSTLPVQELIGDKVVLDWVMHAIADVTLEAKEFDSIFRQPIAAYYRSDPKTTKLDVEETVRQLTSILEAWNSRIEVHFALLDRLYDLDRHLMQKRPWTLGRYYSIWKSSEVGKIREQMQLRYADYENVREETEAVMKSGGAAS